MFLVPLMAILGWTALATEPVAEGVVEPGELKFPDGFKHDFGQVPCGMKVKHVFRIVNKSGVPLEIVSLRIG